MALPGPHPWPGRRVGCWYAGLGCVTMGLTGPIASAAHTSFTAHMGGHLLVGMAGPLLLVLGAPLTLTLRALPATRARLLSRALRSLPVRVLTHPVTAATLNAGGLWARTPPTSTASCTPRRRSTYWSTPTSS